MMESKTLHVLEYPIRFSPAWRAFCDFSASIDLAQSQLQPTADFDRPCPALAETSRSPPVALHHDDIAVGGSHDIRPSLELAVAGGVLDPHALLDIKSTLVACREIRSRCCKPDREGPQRKHTMKIRVRPAALRLLSRTSPLGSRIRIRHCGCDHAWLSDRGDVLDFASPKLGRHSSDDLKVAA